MIEMIESPGIRRDRERSECFVRLFKAALKQFEGELVTGDKMRQHINREYDSVPVAGERRYLSKEEFLGFVSEYGGDS